MGGKINNFRKSLLSNLSGFPYILLDNKTILVFLFKFLNTPSIYQWKEVSIVVDEELALPFPLASVLVLAILGAIEKVDISCTHQLLDIMFEWNVMDNEEYKNTHTPKQDKQPT